MVANVQPIRQRRKEARPGELVAAALELFVKKGYAATRLDDVAACAGVSKGTIYLYFENKEALFKAVLEQGMVPVVEQAEAMIAANEGSAWDLLENLLLTWWKQIGSMTLGGIHKMMISEAGNFPDLVRHYEEMYVSRGRALLRKALELGMARGEFRALDPEVARDVIFAPMMMMSIWRNSVGICGNYHPDPDDYIATHLRLLKRGLLRNSTDER